MSDFNDSDLANCMQDLSQIKRSPADFLAKKESDSGEISVLNKGDEEETPVRFSQLSDREMASLLG